MSLITDFGGLPYGNGAGKMRDASGPAQDCLDHDGILELPAGEWGLSNLTLPHNFCVWGPCATVWSEGEWFNDFTQSGVSLGKYKLHRLWLSPKTKHEGIRVNSDVSHVDFDITHFQNRSTTAAGIRVVQPTNAPAPRGKLIFAHMRGMKWEQHRDATVPMIEAQANFQALTELTMSVADYRCSDKSVFGRFHCTSNSEKFYNIRCLNGGFEKPNAGALHFSGCSDTTIQNCGGYDQTAMTDHTFKFSAEAGGNGCDGGKISYRRKSFRRANWAHDDVHLVPGECKDFDVHGISGHNPATQPTITADAADGHVVRV